VCVCVCVCVFLVHVHVCVRNLFPVCTYEHARCAFNAGHSLQDVRQLTF
jgi:hypothetical protein